jgi:hypothetical protein
VGRLQKGTKGAKRKGNGPGINPEKNFNRGIREIRGRRKRKRMRKRTRTKIGGVLGTSYDMRRLRAGRRSPTRMSAIQQAGMPALRTRYGDHKPR